MINKEILIYGPTIIMLIIFIYDRFRRPEVTLEAEQKKLQSGLSNMELSCRYKHVAIDKSVSEINGVLNLIKENHLRHIENDIAEIKKNNGEKFTKILTILEERNIIK